MRIRDFVLVIDSYNHLEECMAHKTQVVGKEKEIFLGGVGLSFVKNKIKNQREWTLRILQEKERDLKKERYKGKRKERLEEIFWRFVGPFHHV